MWGILLAAGKHGRPPLLGWSFQTSNDKTCPSLKLSPKRTIIHILQRNVVSKLPPLSGSDDSVIVIYPISPGPSSWCPRLRTPTIINRSRPPFDISQSGLTSPYHLGSRHDDLASLAHLANKRYGIQRRHPITGVRVSTVDLMLLVKRSSAGLTANLALPISGVCWVTASSPTKYTHLTIHQVFHNRKKYELLAYLLLKSQHLFQRGLDLTVHRTQELKWFLYP